MDERAKNRIERRAALAVAGLSFVGYFAVARIVGNVYPFSTFPMYAGEHLTSGSRIVAKDDMEHLHEVSDGIAWECDAPSQDRAAQSATPGLDPTACIGRDVYSITYVDREAIDYVRAHPGSDPRSQPVDLVRHIWRFPDGEGPPTQTDCRIARCRALFR
jgi:hypothetical protein